MKVTAKEIAQQLGLSQAAVSLALRGRPGVSEATRRQVLAKAQKLGFAPPEHAQEDPSNMIQLVIFKRHGKVVADTPFFQQLTEGVAERAQELGYHLSVTFFYASQDAAEQLHSLRTLKSVGIVLLATEMRSHDMELFAGIDLPIVLLDNYFTSVRYDSVGIDNRYGAWNAVRYLIECGHIQLGYLHSSVEIRNFAERYDGYLYGCRSLPEGVAKDSSRRIVRVGSSAETAAKDMRAYLATEPMLPSAFFADNDQIAAGCCRALLEEGIRIPQDISIIGFDDSSICTMMSPQLTTMGVHKKRMGGLAVSRLHERLQYHTPENVRTLIQPSIVVRGTVRNRNASDPSR